ncbi:undecaprenyldiphospho-muramoylpentapeptide beta-N-acetylglucosaminyltransferase [Telmatospirillum sp.]|uniref:undecaprenyldiphospho-muramoylpentapeptide beta-N-acetylglucosaminyltransferase n=1 Tax=Telmatospirillum sp. TaxID=2079197 RepID=UPI00283D1F71|nr:undecaprenyldiphospho-muramoylpentapeptide beta-N-acetylglucosaminyltransferase [Telmatospirillum sp.]MDR3435791.1 undecaprenyldiphospho-muramoylpentapeptide beta-N-acetylglucosaminyltransferase [Telmatospirillum sp.]
MTSPDKLIVLTAGGTGGHVFPAEALAAELLGRGRRLALITDRRGQAYGGTLGQLTTHRISAGGIAGRGLGARLSAIGALGFGILQARALLRHLGPAAVVGFGGYASVPAMLAGSFRGIPTILHEQNAVLGRANRLLAARASVIATSFTEVTHIADAHRGKVIRTGMPVRPSIIAQRDQGWSAIGENGPIRLLVLGGSQGARALSEVVPAALAALPEGLRRRLVLSQQCRPEDLDAVAQSYRETDIEVTLESFFHDVPERLAAAHLVIARSGASTVAELTALGRPSILVPYPHAIDDHQTANARALEQAGGAWLIPQPVFTAASLATRLTTLLSEPDSLTRAAASARAAGVPDAAIRLADLVDRLAFGNSEVVS